ncbi:MAG: hypothetical protein M3315_12075, partial [Actinomycetota bacterium]|nr:hypothetical protein [Actinomycetota bacterium]
MMSEQSERISERRGGESRRRPDTVSEFGQPEDGTIAAAQGRSDGPLLALVRETCGSESARATGWRIEPDVNARQIDVRVRNERAEIPEQGWKLHVSADPTSAEAVLR